jgi:hypothetical protein
MTYLPNLDLDYSRPLDVHRWSDYPKVNSFVDKIYCSLPALSGNKQIRKKHLKVLLLDLYVAWTTDPDLKIAISRGMLFQELPQQDQSPRNAVRLGSSLTYQQSLF